MIDFKGRDFGCFWLAKAEMASQKKKSGSKLPHSVRGFLQEQLYQMIPASQGESAFEKEKLKSRGLKMRIGRTHVRFAYPLKINVN